MNLTVRIHDKEYKEEVAQGITFSEEYNETLDSGTVRLTHVRGQIKDLKPYDDVYIYDSAYDFDDNISQWRIGGNLKDDPFYRHLLVDQFSEEIINLSEGIFAYTIELFSETKGLETVQCPNVSVTQPLNVKKKVDIYTYLVRFTNLYSPKYKTIDKDNAGCWAYTRKYRVAPELEGVFSGFYSQDFTLSNPTLRDILSTLMITKDMIPYVKDNVIYAKDISKRTGTYDIAEEQNTGRVNRIVGQMSSADYCDGVRRQYSDALSSDGICNFVEYLGFRNNDNALMTLDNMCVNTTGKIYTVDEFLACYYKKGQMYSAEESKWYDIYFLCEQDITPLIKLDTEWNMLKQDWRDLGKLTNLSIDDLSKYKIGTVHYSIGGNKIEGWGTRYNQIDTTGIFDLGLINIEKTYIENILRVVDNANPFGIRTPKEIINDYIVTHGLSLNPDLCKFVPYVIEDDTTKTMYTYMGLSKTQIYKTISFKIKYKGFYGGALVHSRDIGRDNIYQNDNVSSSLTLLEKDGVAQKEKLNRFANKTHMINGRLDGVNYGVANLLQLGNTGKIGNDDDVIIYRREYSIYDNYISVSYAGIQDYVLKNFYTSVYAKYRVNQLMSYGESTSRAENKKVVLLLSKYKKYKDEETFFNILDDDDKRIESNEFFSAFNGQMKSTNINSSIISTNDGKIYFVDGHVFVSGKNICFNVTMPDNISGGNSIIQYSSEYSLLLNAPSEQSDYYIGSLQEWYNIVDDNETGAISELSFSLSHKEVSPIITAGTSDTETAKIDNFYQYSMTLPKKVIEIPCETTNEVVIPYEKIYKDNKERIDITLQIEPISLDKNDIVFSVYFAKLSNLVFSSDNGKNEQDTNIGTRKVIIKSAVDIYFYFYGLDKNGTQISIASNPDDLSEDADKKAYQELLTYIYEHNIGDKPTGIYRVPVSLTLNFSGEDDKTFYFGATHIGYIDKDVTGKAPQPGSGYSIVLWGTGNNGGIPLGGDPAIQFDTFDDTLYYTYKTDQVNNASSVEIPYQIGQVIESYEDVPQTLQKNMFIEYSTDYVDANHESEILPTDTDKTFSDKKVSNVFYIVGGGDESILRVDVSDITAIDKEGNITILNNIKSINYWYFDFNSAYNKDYSGREDIVYNYTPEKSGYYFVFGINLYPEDIKKDGDKRYIDIYITKTTNRDERVFDGIGRQVGIIHNCVDKEGNYIAPTQQEYDTINEYPEGDITITLQSAMGNHTKQWKCYQSEIIQPNFSIDEKEYKAKHGTSVKYWIDGSGKKHDDGYAMVVNNNETLTFYGEDWWKTLDISNMSTVERHLSPTYIDDTYVAVPRSLSKTFNITGDVKAYPVTVKGTVELTIEYNGKTTSKSHDFSVELEEFDDKTEIPNPVFGITTDDQDATSIFSLYYRKYTPDDDYKLVWQIRTTLTGANYEGKGELTLKAGVAINEIIQPYLLQE